MVVEGGGSGEEGKNRKIGGGGGVKARYKNAHNLASW